MQPMADRILARPLVPQQGELCHLPRGPADGTGEGAHRSAMRHGDSDQQHGGIDNGHGGADVKATGERYCASCGRQASAVTQPRATEQHRAGSLAALV
jgi:hypothetical protein